MQKTDEALLGVFSITNDDYHSSPGVSRSMLMLMEQSPLHYWHQYINPDFIKPEPTEPMVFGSAVHTAVLEPHQFHDQYYALDKIDRRTTAGKAQYAKAMAESAGKQLLSCEQYDAIKQINTTIHNNAEARQLIDYGKIERSIYWQDPDTGLLCKCRPDIWHDDMIIDLKTAKDATFRAFRNETFSRGYHIQAGMIQEALRHACNKEMYNFVYLTIEKTPPYAIAIFILDEEVIEHGVQEFKRLLQRLKHCKDANIWPSYETRTLTLPGYFKYEVIE
jgi:exodeoxyribonuclease VIII